MFNHIMVGTNDLERSKSFYDAVLAVLGAGPGWVHRHRVFWRSGGGVFASSLPIDGEAASAGNGATVGFRCDSPGQVDAWHAAGLANGGRSIEDAPGYREGPTGTTYLAYLRDPDGNKLCRPPAAKSLRSSPSCARQIASARLRLCLAGRLQGLD